MLMCKNRSWKDVTMAICAIGAITTLIVAFIFKIGWDTNIDCKVTITEKISDDNSYAYTTVTKCDGEIFPTDKIPTLKVVRNPYVVYSSFLLSTYCAFGGIAIIVLLIKMFE